MDLEIDKIENFLDKITLTHVDIEQQMLTIKYIYGNENGEKYGKKIRSTYIEDRMLLPLHSIAFYDLVKKNNKIPTQSEYYEYYLDINSNDASVKLIVNNKNKIYLAAKMFRAWASYVRDLHFALLWRSEFNNTSNDAFYNLELDAKNDIDVGLLLDGNIIGINLYTNTEWSEKKRAKKTYRHTLFGNVIYVGHKMFNRDDQKYGEVFLYNNEDIKNIKSKINIELEKLIYSIKTI